MKIEPLDLSHQPLLETKLKELDISLSEYCFGNLYLFRHIHQYEVVRLSEEVFIRGITRDKIPFIMLTAHPSKIPLPLIKEALTLGQILFPIPQEWLYLLDKWLVQASFKEEESDYLYTQVKLATYPGRHLDGKRNQVHQLLNHYEIKSEIFSHQMEDVQYILDAWQSEHDGSNNEADYSSCQEAILNFHRLHLQGRIVYVNQQPVGFTMGEWISKNCYTIHFSKALRSIKGLYQYLIQESARPLENGAWINLEQDLGILTLRQSKLSYQPDVLLKKWRVQLQ